MEWLAWAACGFGIPKILPVRTDGERAGPSMPRNNCNNWPQAALRDDRGARLSDARRGIEPCQTENANADTVKTRTVATGMPVIARCVFRAALDWAPFRPS